MELYYMELYRNGGEAAFYGMSGKEMLSKRPLFKNRVAEAVERAADPDRRRIPRIYVVG